jgi:hypothetical protein
MARISTKQVISMTVKELRSHLREQSANLSFSTLSRYRKALLASAKPAEAGDDGAVAEGAATEEAVDQDKKARAVYALLRERVDTGEPVKRRKAGTGAKREIQVPYKDTLANRKAGRVGTSYSKVVYDDAVVEEVPRKLRKQKRVIDPSKKRTGNAWIKAVSAAKKEAGAPAFLIIRKASDDPNDVGVRVYHRAKEIMAEMKAATDKAAAGEAAAGEAAAGDAGDAGEAAAGEASDAKTGQ